MSRISTHVLDTALGAPAAGIAVRLERQSEACWEMVAVSATDSDGRCRELATDAAAGAYRITFAAGEYFERGGRRSIYPEIAVTFRCDGTGYYHLPLLLSDNSYTTYRGS